jgi:hypothetical protein
MKRVGTEWKTAMNMRPVVLAAAYSVALGLPSSLRTGDSLTDAHAVSVQSNVVYGQGLVGATSPKPHLRDLKMDVCRPLADGKPLSGRPAVTSTRWAQTASVTR